MKHRVNQIQNGSHNGNFYNRNCNWRHKNPNQKVFERAQPALSVDAMVVHRNEHQQAEANEKQYV